MSDLEGWIAAGISCLAYGSYGVPIKATLDVDVHPLVLQTYKTVVLFAMSWIPCLLLGERLRITPLGILSGLLWVTGGSFGIMAIRLAGMAVAVGTWSSVMVLVNFIWGIWIFQEPVHSKTATSGAFFLLTLGLIGMSRYSAPETKEKSSLGSRQPKTELLDHDDMLEESSTTSTRSREQEEEASSSSPPSIHVSASRDDRSILKTRKNSSKLEETGSAEETEPMIAANKKNTSVDLPSTTTFHLCGASFSNYQYGRFCAMMNGALAGSSLLPLHYAKKDGFGGMSYILSFGCGSLAANLSIWYAFFLYKHLAMRGRGRGDEKSRLIGFATCQETFESNMPPLHFQTLWKRGLIAGILLAVAMFGSILATSSLGQGVGNSLVQCKILVSGLWGIFWFREIRSCSYIVKWLLSAMLSVTGILWLSHERLAAKR